MSAHGKLKTRPQPTVAIETWTWEQAQEALQQMVINRPFRDWQYQMYSRMMTTLAANGHPLWRNCAAPITIDWDGNLIDGQHRLSAQVTTKTTQTWIVSRNVDPEIQKTIDTGLMRSPADQLRFEGFNNNTILSSVARWGWLLEKGLTGHGKIKVSHEEILDIVDRHPDLQHSAHMGAYARTGFIDLTPTPLGAAHWWIAQHNDHAEADLFIDRLVHMNREAEGSAVLALLKRFSEIRRHKTKVPTRVQIAMVIKAWNFDVQGKYVSKISTHSRHGEIKMQDVLGRQRSQEPGVELPFEDAS